MGRSDDARPEREPIDAEAFLGDETLIAFFAKQRGLSIDEARARLKEILESVDSKKA